MILCSSVLNRHVRLLYSLLFTGFDFKDVIVSYEAQSSRSGLFSYSSMFYHVLFFTSCINMV